jgi:hypothetical protein
VAAGLDAEIAKPLRGLSYSRLGTEIADRLITTIYSKTPKQQSFLGDKDLYTGLYEKIFDHVLA